MQLATSSESQPFTHSPAIVGGFQENNLQSDNRTQFESLLVSEGMAIHNIWKQQWFTNERSKDHK
jgi:hypothetical protein